MKCLKVMVMTIMAVLFNLSNSQIHADALVKSPSKASILFNGEYKSMSDPDPAPDSFNTQEKEKRRYR